MIILQIHYRHGNVSISFIIFIFYLEPIVRTMDRYLMMRSILGRQLEKIGLVKGPLEEKAAIRKFVEIISIQNSLTRIG